MPRSTLIRVLGTKAPDPTCHKGRSLLRSLITLQALLCLFFLAGCGGGGSSAGGGSTGGSTGNGPTPFIVSLTPNSATAGTAGFTLTITGNNFISSSTAEWNGTQRATTFVSSTQLQAQITPADIASPGSATVSVTDPSPGGGNSGLAEFTINPISNPAPTLKSLSPPRVDAGSSGFVLTLNGSNFLPSSTIQWNGTAIPTSYLSSTQIEAQVPSSVIATPGFAEVAVSNPLPGGGISAILILPIAYVPTVVSQAANDLVWDSTHQLIYLSVPSFPGANGNTISALNPATGLVQASQFAGSEPDALAISDDNQFLYAGIDGASAVQRFTLPNLLPDVKYSLGAYSNLGPTYAVDLQVAPALPHTTAVSRGAFNLNVQAIAGMVIYDDATPRPTIAPGSGPVYDSLQWGSDTAIYANNGEISSLDFYVLSVSSAGVVLTKDYPNDFSSFYISIHYDKGTKLVYSDDGNVINPTNGQLAGFFHASGLMIPDSGLNRAFFLGQTASQVNTRDFSIEAFDLTTMLPVAEVVVPDVQGIPLHLIRWGTNGLAFNDDAGYVYLLANPFTTASGAPVLTFYRFLTPVQKTKSASTLIRRRNDVVSRTFPLLNSKAIPFNSGVANPSPAITDIVPSAVTAGVNDFTLTVNGTNFISLSTIQWNGTSLPTEFVSSTQLQAQVSASQVANSGSASVAVVTPGPGGGTSASLTFAVMASAAANPVPVILALYPQSVPAGSSGFTLDINGNFFNSSSVVKWNGIPRPSLLYSPGQLQVQISASDVSAVGYAQVTVTNAAPGGGISNTAEFDIPYQPTIVTQTANNIIWDPLNHVIYASIPASASTHANQVCIINPLSASIVMCQNAGTQPDVLAISDDSHFLYVGEDGSGTVQRFILPNLTADISFGLGSASDGNRYYALDMEVAPGAPHTIAVSKGELNLEPAATGGITIFDDSTPRPTTAPGTFQLYSSIQWGSDATQLYAANSESSGLDFYTLQVSASGVVLQQDYPSVFWNPGRIHYDHGSGLVYSDDGFHAVDPATGLPAGIYELGGGWPMAPDFTLNTVFILTKLVFQANPEYTIALFDMHHFVPITHFPFSTPAVSGLGRLGRFIRCGNNGLAFNDTSGNIYLLSGPFLTP